MLTITYRWFKPVNLLLFAFSVLWCGFNFSFVRRRWHEGVEGPLDLLFIGAGFWILYYSLASLFNRTRVVVKAGELWIRQGPLPWLGDAFIPAGGVRQLYCEETLSRGRYSSTSYHLVAITRDHRKLRVARSMPSADVVLYLEQEIETALGIKDSPVQGEFPK